LTTVSVPGRPFTPVQFFAVVGGGVAEIDRHVFERIADFAVEDRRVHARVPEQVVAAADLVIDGALGLEIGIDSVLPKRVLKRSKIVGKRRAIRNIRVDMSRVAVIVDERGLRIPGMAVGERKVDEATRCLGGGIDYSPAPR
jgi:hypothetical protein